MTETYSAPLSQRRISPRQGEHHLFARSALSIAVLVFVGFSRTYSLHARFGTPDLSMFLNVHGAVMTGWIVLFGAQTVLIASNHTRVHRVLGTFGLGYAALVVAMGSAATILAARREARADSVFVSSFLTVLALELTQMFLFYNSDGSIVIFLTAQPGTQGENTDAYSVAYERFQPGISEKTISALTQGKIICQ